MILKAVRSGACDGDEAGISINQGASLRSPSLVCSTPSDHGAIDSKGDAVKFSARDGDEVRIRRSVVPLTPVRVTPSDHGAVSAEINPPPGELSK